MKKFVIFAFACIVLLQGCVLTIFHKCPPPEKSTECYPICKFIKEKNNKDTLEQWVKFKNTPHYPFAPTHRYPKIDEIGKMMSYLSFQVKNEIVIPYIEMDKDGLICGYHEFEKDVNAVMSARKCDLQEAMRLVLEDWQKMPDGQEKCQKLVQSIPVLQSLKASNQIRKAVYRLGPEVVRIIILIRKDKDFKKEINLMKEDVKNARNMFKNSKDSDARSNFSKGMESTNNLLKGLNAALSFLANSLELQQSIAFLEVLYEDKSSQQDAMEKFILDIDKMSNDAKQLNQ